MQHEAECHLNFVASQERHLQPGHASCSQHALLPPTSAHEHGQTPSLFLLFEAGICNMDSVIVHDLSSDYDDNKCPTNPDIAGLGVSSVTRSQRYICSNRLITTGCDIVHRYGDTHHSSLSLCCLFGRGVACRNGVFPEMSECMSRRTFEQ